MRGEGLDRKYFKKKCIATKHSASIRLLLGGTQRRIPGGKKCFENSNSSKFRIYIIWSFRVRLKCSNGVSALVYAVPKLRSPASPSPGTIYLHTENKEGTISLSLLLDAKTVQ